jgi:ArsR family transcriptional regulator
MGRAMTTRRQLIAEMDGCGSAAVPAPLDEDDAIALADTFAALADPVRLRALSILCEAGPDGVCVCDLVAPLDRTQPTVSHHLKVLADAGWITGDRRGRWVWYSVVPDRLEAVRAAVFSP